MLVLSCRRLLVCPVRLLLQALVCHADGLHIKQSLEQPSFQGLHYPPAPLTLVPGAAADVYTMAQGLGGKPVPGTFRSCGQQLAAHSALLAPASGPKVVSFTKACDLSSAAAQGAGGSFDSTAGVWDRSVPVRELHHPL